MFGLLSATCALQTAFYIPHTCCYQHMSFPGTLQHKKEKNLYICINKDGNPSQKVEGMSKHNVDTLKENQNNHHISNEVKDIMRKGHPLPQIS
jgi:hypothetical protein